MNMIKPQETLQYVDYNDALSRLYGNIDIYKSLLSKFICSTLLDELEYNLKNNKIDDAIISVHSMKGIAANLSLKVMYDHALKFEQSIKLNNTVNFDDIKNTWHKTVEQINIFIDNF